MPTPATAIDQHPPPPFAITKSRRRRCAYRGQAWPKRCATSRQARDPDCGNGGQDQGSVRCAARSRFRDHHAHRRDSPSKAWSGAGTRRAYRRPAPTSCSLRRRSPRRGRARGQAFQRCAAALQHGGQRKTRSVPRRTGTAWFQAPIYPNWLILAAIPAMQTCSKTQADRSMRHLRDKVATFNTSPTSRLPESSQLEGATGCRKTKRQL